MLKSKALANDLLAMDSRANISASLLLGAILITFIGMKLTSWLWHAAFSDGGVLLLDLYSMAVACAAFLFLGILLGVFFRKQTFTWGEKEEKITGVGVFGLFFATSLCFGGACIPAAVLASAGGVIGFLPVLLGAKLSKYFFPSETSSSGVDSFSKFFERG